MALWANNLVFDKGLTFISTTGLRVFLCTTQPDTKDNATGAYMRGYSTALDFDAIRDSTMIAGGRALPIQATSNVVIKSSGPIHHIAITSNSTLVYVTMCTTRNATTGDTVTVPVWRIEINDATT